MLRREHLSRQHHGTESRFLHRLHRAGVNAETLQTLDQKLAVVFVADDEPAGDSHGKSEARKAVGIDGGRNGPRQFHDLANHEFVSHLVAALGRVENERGKTADRGAIPLAPVDRRNEIARIG
jgi:hypothetical protein